MRKVTLAVAALAALAGSLALAPEAQAQARQWQTVRIATEGAYAPWNFTVAGGRLDGFEIDLANDLCRRMNVRCEVIAQDWDGIIPALVAGKYDAIMAGMNITDRRLETINFSRPYAGGPHGFATLKSSPLARVAGAGTIVPMGEAAASRAAIDALRTALRGRTIGVQVSTTNANFVNEFFKDVATIREYKTTEEHDLDLINGRVDAIYAAHTALVATMENAQFRDMTLVGPGFRGGLLGRGVAVGLRKTDPELQALFDKAITEALADGTISRLSVKWFKTDIAAPQS
ncbi:MAG: ABC transporter substrate-binding protein [Alphaproteobacteria bacterium]|nr:transporter substrate-binding domain-containing protein [Alphaproteobacteria bacterium]TAD88564.1 MAG: ABC transporter substrate-binding protein [Alphaproteobacteria bacterium]